MSSSQPPAAISRKLEQTLAQWRHWQCDPPLPGAPHIERPINGGLSNYNFLVSAAEQRYVVRIDGINPNRHGLNRQVEFVALQSAGRAGLSPLPRYFNPELGALVCDHIEADEEQTTDPVRLAQLCRQIHALPPRRHKLDLPARIRRYENLLQRSRSLLPIEAVRTAVHAALDHSDDPALPTVLCHNDLLPANLLRSGGQLLALDWEYCAMGKPWFDLAVASGGQMMNRDDCDRFLGHYLQREVGTEDRHQLQRHLAIYRYIELLWHLTEAPEDRAEAELRARLPLVEQALS